MPAQENLQKNQTGETGQKPIGESDIFVWNSPARPFKRRNREFYITIIAMAAVVSLVLFLIEGFMPVVLLVSLVFLFYILNTVEPATIEYKFTNKGIRIAGERTEWNIITRFWFSRRYDSDLIIFEKLTIPGRMELVIREEDKDKIRESLKEYVVEEEVPPSFLDRGANWFSKKLPGNK